MNKRKQLKELKELIRTMDVPEMRRETSKNENVRWLQRNLMIRNADHENLNKAQELIRSILFRD